MDTKQTLQKYIADNVFVSGADVSLYKPNGEASSSMFDFRKCILNPEFLALYVKLFFEATEDMKTFQVCGLESTSLPLLTALALHGKQYNRSINAFFIRKSRKKDGALTALEGVVTSEPIILVDDILHSGASFQKQLAVLDAIHEHLPETPHVTTIFPILLYKKEESYSFIKERGIDLRYIFTIKDFYERFPVLTKGESSLSPSTVVSLTNKNLAWTFKPENPNLFLITPKSPPGISGDMLYLGADNGTLYALRTHDGTSVFTYHVRAASVTERTFSNLIITKQLLMFRAGDKNLHAIDRITGKRVWVFLEADITSRDMAYNNQNGVVFVCGETGLFKKNLSVYAIDVTHGKKLWEVSRESFKDPYMVYSKAYGLLFVYDKDGILYALREDSGEILWSHATGLVPSAAPSLSEDERCLLVSGIDSDEIVHVLTFEVRKKKSISEYTEGLYGVSGKVLVVGDTGFVGGLDKVLRAFSITNGKTLWSVSLTGRILASPLYVIRNDGKRCLYVGTTAGYLYCVDLKTGELLSQVIISERIVNEGVYDASSSTYFLASAAQEIYALRDGHNKKETR